MKQSTNSDSVIPPQHLNEKTPLIKPPPLWHRRPKEDPKTTKYEDATVFAEKADEEKTEKDELENEGEELSEIASKLENRWPHLKAQVYFWEDLSNLEILEDLVEDEVLHKFKPKYSSGDVSLEEEEDESDPVSSRSIRSDADDCDEYNDNLDRCYHLQRTKKVENLGCVVDLDYSEDRTSKDKHEIVSGWRLNVFKDDEVFTNGEATLLDEIEENDITNDSSPSVEEPATMEVSKREYLNLESTNTDKEKQDPANSIHRLKVMFVMTFCKIFCCFVP